MSISPYKIATEVVTKYLISQLNRSITHTESKLIENYIYINYKKQNINETAKQLLKLLSKPQFKQPNIPINIKEYLDAEINKVVEEPIVPFDLVNADTEKELNIIADNSDTNTSITIESILNSTDLINKFRLSDFRTKKFKMLLDRRYRIDPLVSGNKFSWNITDTYVESPASVQVTKPLHNIISVKISDFYLNNSVYTLNTSVDPTLNVFPSRYFTVLIEELSNQAFITNNNRKFHFWGTLVDPGWVSPPTYLIRFSNNNSTAGYMLNNNITERFPVRRYDGNEGKYIFNYPVTKLDNITISIGHIYDLITLPPDYFTFTYVDPNLRSFTINGDPNMLDELRTRLFITGFNTDQPVADASLINFLNSPGGVVGYHPTGWAAGTYTVDLLDDEGQNITADLTMNGNQVGTAYVYFNFNRFYIPLEFECIE